MSELYDRQLQIILGKGGQGIAITDLRVSFKIKKTATKAPNEAVIKIYNLASTTLAQIGSEFNDVILSAGYKGLTSGRFGVIFQGNLKFKNIYKDGADKIAELTCGDGDRDYNDAFVNISCAAGSTTRDAVNACLASFADTKAGVIKIAGIPRLRGRVYCGPARDVLDDVVNAEGALWSIQDGVLHLLPTADLLPGQAIPVGESTGMIGIVEQTEKGVKAKTLLDHRMKVHLPFQLFTSNIKLNTTASAKVAGLSATGLYKTTVIEHTGDTFDKDWYTAIEGVAA